MRKKINYYDIDRSFFSFKIVYMYTALDFENCFQFPNRVKRNGQRKKEQKSCNNGKMRLRTPLRVAQANRQDQ